jgi:hypothetical protein
MEPGGGLMRAAERYRHYAAECIRRARKADSPAEKDLLLQMAEHWRRMAERDEEAKEWTSPRGS